MNRTITAEPNDSHRVIPETRPQMAKAHLRKTETENWRRAVGRMVEALRRSRGWTLDEFAGKLAKDPRQVARWERGEERAQLDALLAIEELHQPLLLVFADLVRHCVRVKTTIEIERVA